MTTPATTVGVKQRLRILSSVGRGLVVRTACCTVRAMALAVTVLLVTGRGGAQGLFREFHPKENLPAAEAFERMEMRPLERAPRAELARIYAGMNLEHLASFIESTSEILEGGRPRVPPRERNKPKWVCPEQPSDVMSQDRLAARLETLVLEGNYVAAKSQAELALKKAGYSCTLFVEWANTVIHVGMLPAKEVNWAERELAFRTLFVGAEEIPIYPGRISFGSTVLQTVALYFRVNHDLVSAYAAAAMSRERIETEVTSEEGRSLDLANADREIASIRAALRSELKQRSSH
jgi:hypothetical protein